jgi:voltage-gated sodium channel
MEQFLEDVPHTPTKHGAVLLKRRSTHDHKQSPFGAREFWLGDEALYCSKIGSRKALECIRLDDVHSVSAPQCMQTRQLEPLHFLDSSGTGTDKQDHGHACHHAAGRGKDNLSSRSISMQEEINLVCGMTHTHDRANGAHVPAPHSHGALQTLHTVDIITEESSCHAGSMIIFACISEREAGEWVAALRASKSKLELLHEKEHGAFAYWIHRLCLMYEGNIFQFVMASIIVCNFLTNVVEAEICPLETCRAFETLDLLFTICFCLDLLFNMAAHAYDLPFRFLFNSWNVLDVVVVITSLFTLFFGSLPESIKVIRIMRAFRVVRILRRLKSLRLIVSALCQSVVPVANTFFVLMVVTSIYAILAVSLFSERQTEHFGHFSQAFFTMFQCVTGDGWASTVARPMFLKSGGSCTYFMPISSISDPLLLGAIAGEQDGEVCAFEWGVAFFFLSYIMVVMVVIVNIVLAVLLDEFLKAAEVEKQQDLLHEHATDPQVVSHIAKLTKPIDPFLSCLAEFTTSSSLRESIEDAFHHFDSDDDGLIDWSDLNAGLRSMAFGKGKTTLTIEDFAELTRGGGLCSPEGQLSLEQFDLLCHEMMCDYVQRQSAKMMFGFSNISNEGRLLTFAIRYLIAAVDELQCKVPRRVHGDIGSFSKGQLGRGTDSRHTHTHTHTHNTGSQRDITGAASVAALNVKEAEKTDSKLPAMDQSERCKEWCQGHSSGVERAVVWGGVDGGETGALGWAEVAKAIAEIRAMMSRREEERERERKREREREREREKDRDVQRKVEAQLSKLMVLAEKRSTTIESGNENFPPSLSPVARGIMRRCANFAGVAGAAASRADGDGAGAGRELHVGEQAGRGEREGEGGREEGRGGGGEGGRGEGEEEQGTATRGVNGEITAEYEKTPKVGGDVGSLRQVELILKGPQAPLTLDLSQVYNYIMFIFYCICIHTCVYVYTRVCLTNIHFVKNVHAQLAHT